MQHVTGAPFRQHSEGYVRGACTGGLGSEASSPAEDFKGRACVLHAAAQIHLHSIHAPTHPPQILQQQQLAAAGQMAHTKVANCFQRYLLIRRMYVTQALNPRLSAFCHVAVV